MRTRAQYRTPCHAGGGNSGKPWRHVMRLMRLGLCLAAALAFWSLRVEASLAADSYNLTTIEYPGARATFVNGVNDRGDMAGSYRVPGTRHAILIRDGVFITPPPTSTLGANWSEAYKSNGRGDIVGDFSLDNGFTVHGFLVTSRDYELRTIDFPGACNTHARAINESGTVVGFWEECDSEGGLLALHGFIWSKGEFSEVDFPGATNTFLTGINARGDIVGSWQSESTIHGLIFSQGQFLSFDAPFPDTDTEPQDINAPGDIVGAYYDADGVGHGFLAAGETFTTIDYPGATRTAVAGINSAGQIVGTHSEGGPNQGFVGQPGNKKKP
jgi:uncharacterized membrane protein